MNINEKLLLLDQQIEIQMEVIARLERSESPEFYRTPSSWSLFTLTDRSKAVECLCDLQKAKKDLILSESYYNIDREEDPDMHLV
jgi:hypothetical protein